MLDLLIKITFILFISLIPIVAWAYIFSYIDDNKLNKKRFFVGILAGGLSVIPIFYTDTILSAFDLKYLNSFAFVHNITGIISSLEFGFSLGLFLVLLALFSFIIGVVGFRFRKILKVYFKNIFVFLVFAFVLSGFVYLINLVGGNTSFLDARVGEGIAFGDIIFNSFKLILFYYLIVAFIEESSKHFNFLQSSILQIDSVKTGVLYAIFVALGFSLIENVLYFYSVYSSSGFGQDLVKIYFFRSIFSVIVHVLSSSVVAYYFSKALLLYRQKDLSFPYLKIFLSGLFLSIFLHLFFDVALTLGFSFVIILYFIGGYLYISSIFYRE